MSDWSLERNGFGRLVFRGGDGGVHEGVIPVRAFPIAAPDEGISLVNTEGHEVAWIDRLGEIPEAVRSLVAEDLASREFMPEIRRLLRVSSFATPSTWEVETDRGATTLILKGEEDIRRLGHTALLIADSHGINYLIRDLPSLDAGSRRLLDRFL